MSKDEQEHRRLAVVRPIEDGRAALNKYAQHLRRESAGGAGLLPLLSTGEADAVAALLDELAQAHTADELGALASDLATRLRQRLADQHDE